MGFWSAVVAIAGIVAAAIPKIIKALKEKGDGKTDRVKKG